MDFFSSKRALLTLMIVAYSAINLAYAKGQGRIVVTSVPFQNVQLNQGDTLIASFSFGIQKQIFCYDNFFQNVGVVTWPFQGQPNNGILPIFLTTQPGVIQGSGIDANGNFAIFNNTSTLFLNCQFSL